MEIPNELKLSLEDEAILADFQIDFSLLETDPTKNPEVGIDIKPANITQQIEQAIRDKEEMER